MTLPNAVATAAPQPPGRPLGAFEEALTLTADHSPFNVVAVLRLAPGPPPERLADALRWLQGRHPLLGVRLVREGRRFAFAGGGVPAIPLRLAGGSWQAEAEEELNRAFDRSAGPLARVAYLPPAVPGGPADLVLAVHHAIVDGPSLEVLLGEVVAALGEAGPPATPPPSGLCPLPPPADFAFPRRFRGWGRWRSVGPYLLRQLAGEVAYRRRTRGRRPPPAPPDARCCLLTFALSPPATVALVRRSRQQRVTLASAASAALLLAVDRRRYGGRALPLRTFVFPDLRPYLRPPVPPQVLASHLSMVPLVVEVAGSLAVWELGRRIQDQVYAAARRGEKFLAALASPWSMRAVLGRPTSRMGTTAVNYAGAPRLGEGPGCPRVEALHAFVSNLHLGPEYTAQARLFGGRLCWDVVYLDRDMEAAEAGAIAAEIGSILEAAGQVRAPPGGESGRFEVPEEER